MEQKIKDFIEKWDYWIEENHYPTILKDFKQDLTNLLDNWISVEDELPICTELGVWDGLRSEKVTVIDECENVHSAYLYSGKMDGSEFNNWYDINDDEFDYKITHFQIPQPPKQPAKKRGGCNP